MSMPTENPRSDLPLYRAERIIASMTVAWVIVLSTYMLFQNTELSYTSVYFLKIILALSGAVMLATLPGFFDIGYNLSGFSVRAAGGAAAFVFIYTQSPNIPALQAEPVATPPIEERDRPSKSDKLSSSHDGYPVLFAMSISPASFAPQPSYYTTSYGGSNLAAQQSDSTGPISIGEAIIRDIGAIASAILSILRSGLSHATAVLEGGAITFRNTADVIGSLVVDILSQIIQTASAATDALPAKAFAFVSDVQDTTSQFLQETTELFSDTYDDLIGGPSAPLGLIASEGKAKGLIKQANGLIGNEHGLSKQANGLTGSVNGLAGKMNKAANSVSSKTAKATSGMMGNLSRGIDKITRGLNAVSPDIVSRINPDFDAAAKPHGSSGKNSDRGVQPFSSTVYSLSGEEFDLEGSLMGPDRFEGISDTLTFAENPRDQRNNGNLLRGEACISGCNPRASRRQLLGSGLGTSSSPGHGRHGGNNTPSGGGGGLNTLSGNSGNGGGIGGGSTPGGGRGHSSAVKSNGASHRGRGRK